MARRIEQVRFILPKKGKPMILVSFSDNSRLVLKQGEMAVRLDRLRRTYKGQTKAFVIHEMAYGVLMGQKGSIQFWKQDLMVELRAWVDDHCYDSKTMKTKTTKPAKR